MTTAPAADQRRLLELQQLDTRANKLAHQRRTLPALEALKELEGRAEDLHRAQVLATSEVSDLRREVTRAETDVSKVRTRLDATRETYNSGQGLSRELLAMSQDIESMERRVAVLEEAELELMGRLEEAEGRAAELARQEENLRADQALRTRERDEQWEHIDGELAQVRSDREALNEALRASSAEMVDLYERARERSGGLGAVAMYGHRSEGVALDLTLAELNALDTAAEDTVVLSEDHGYVLVRLGEK